jgi:hypothetical protein
VGLFKSILKHSVSPGTRAVHNWSQRNVLGKGPGPDPFDPTDTNAYVAQQTADTQAIRNTITSLQSADEALRASAVESAQTLMNNNLRLLNAAGRQTVEEPNTLLGRTKLPAPSSAATRI